MLRAKTGQQKFPTLKKTTGLCPSRCCYSMLCCKSRMVPTVQYVWQIHVSSPPSPSPHPFCYWAAFCWESCRFLWSAPAIVFTNIFPVLLFPYLLPEPGTLQHCRDNATMFSGQHIVECGIMSIFVVASPPRTFFVFFLVSEAALRCRIVVVGKLINCRVPSSVLPLLLNPYTRIFSVGWGSLSQQKK